MNLLYKLKNYIKKGDILFPGNMPEPEIFNIVVNELTTAYNKMESFNQKLEQQVILRTKELQESQEQLIAQNKEFSSLNKEYLKQNIDIKKAFQKSRRK